MAIVAFLIGMGLFMSFDYYRRSLLNDERDLVVALLLQARSRALDNLYQSPHGVCLIPPDYVVFRGPDCTAGLPGNELVPTSAALAVTGLDPSAPVVFNQLSGDASTTDISVSHGANIKTIHINDEGRIDW